jgi:hypothetical protein
MHVLSNYFRLVVSNYFQLGVSNYFQMAVSNYFSRPQRGSTICFVVLLLVLPVLGESFNKLASGHQTARQVTKLHGRSPNYVRAPQWAAVANHQTANALRNQLAVAGHQTARLFTKLRARSAMSCSGRSPNCAYCSLALLCSLAEILQSYWYRLLNAKHFRTEVIFSLVSQKIRRVLRCVSTLQTCIKIPWMNIQSNCMVSCHYC